MQPHSFLRAALALTLGSAALAQGPVILMGIDAEDGGPGGHGPVSAYASVVGGGLDAHVDNGGAGMIVFGAGKDPQDDVTLWWNALSNQTGIPVTLVNSPADILNASLDGFAIVGVASSLFQSPNGGMTPAENSALATKSADIAAHINGGGGLFGLSQMGFTSPYEYLGSIGNFTFDFPTQFNQVTPTAEGQALGITNNVLDICCWHDEYLTFPGFLDVLVTNDATGNACAVGGSDVVIVDGILLTPFFASNAVGGTHTVTATVADSNGNPVAGKVVNFSILSGPHGGVAGSDVTDADGEAEFTYSGASVGSDQIEACTGPMPGSGGSVCSNIVTSEWFSAGCFVISFEDDGQNNALVNGQEVNPANSFGTLVSIDGSAAGGLGAAVFDSGSNGPNNNGSDEDLLVDQGNVLILQQDPTQTIPGIYDTPNDHYNGGGFLFHFHMPASLCSIDLIDIDVDGWGAQDAFVTLYDTLNRQRTYYIPGGWTGDLALGGTGVGTLDLTVITPQPGFASTATCTEDQNFDPDGVLMMVVEMTGSGAIDNVQFQSNGTGLTRGHDNGRPDRGRPERRRR